MKNIVERLIQLNKTISTMESCTGGAIVNSITNIEGSSNILKYSALTYSNEYKIKMGVPKEIIDKYSVYSIEVAKEMSKCISKYTNSNYGIGITGKINKIDPNNDYGKDNEIFISIYDKDNNKYYTKVLNTINASRNKNKEYIVEEVINLLNNILDI